MMTTDTCNGKSSSRLAIIPRGKVCTNSAGCVHQMKLGMLACIACMCPHLGSQFGLADFLTKRDDRNQLNDGSREAFDASAMPNHACNYSERDKQHLMIILSLLCVCLLITACTLTVCWPREEGGTCSFVHVNHTQEHFEAI